MTTPCRYCGVVGICLVGCQCAKCLDPVTYHHWVRNLPGDNKSKALVDRERRIVLEACGQRSMLPEIWNRDRMFSALRDRFVLILERTLEKVRAVKDGLSALHLAVATVKEFNLLLPDLTQFTDAETSS